jgi:hypothetical protein
LLAGGDAHDGVGQGVRLQVLGDEACRAGVQCPPQQPGPRQPGEDQDLGVGGGAGEFGGGADAVPARQFDVEHGDIRPVLGHRGRDQVPGGDFGDHRDVAAQFQQLAHRLPEQRDVLGQNYPHHEYSIVSSHARV